MQLNLKTALLASVALDVSERERLLDLEVTIRTEAASLSALGGRLQQMYIDGTAPGAHVLGDIRNVLDEALAALDAYEAAS